MSMAKFTSQEVACLKNDGGNEVKVYHFLFIIDRLQFNYFVIVNYLPLFP